ncbi:MAG: SRPBCC family protein [Candidatus Limnocylindrales bacterium]
MITPKATITVGASPRDVITYIADPATAPVWMKALETSELITRGPIQPGSRFREVQSAGGERIETICEVVEYDGETRYAWRSVGDGPAQYGGGFTATPSDAGTELRYEGWATATGRLAEREAAWARQAQREAEAELAAIKEAVEQKAD